MSFEESASGESAPSVDLHRAEEIGAEDQQRGPGKPPSPLKLESYQDFRKRMKGWEDRANEHSNAVLARIDEERKRHGEERERENREWENTQERDREAIQTLLREARERQLHVREEGGYRSTAEINQKAIMTRMLNEILKTETNQNLDSRITFRSNRITEDRRAITERIIVRLRGQSMKDQDALRQVFEVKDKHPDLLTQWYQEYFSSIQEHDGDREKGINTLKLSIARDLSACGIALSPEQVESVARTLSEENQITQYTSIIYQQRLLLALEVDRKHGSKFADLLDEIQSTDEDAATKLARIDCVLQILSQAQVQDATTKQWIESLQGLNRNQILASDALKFMEIQQGISRMAIAERVKTIDRTLTESYPTMDTEERLLFTNVASLPQGEIVEKIVQNGKVEKVGENLYRGTLEGQEVYIQGRKGEKAKLFVKTKDNQSIEIEPTTPAALGFDTAVAQKEIHNASKWKALGRKDVPVAFLPVNTRDSLLARDSDVEKYRSLLKLILPPGTSSPYKFLRDCHVIQSDGSLRPRYAEGILNTLKHWAPGGDLRNLSKETITPKTILALTSIWYQRETGKPILANREHDPVLSPSTPLPKVELSAVRKKEKEFSKTMEV